MAATVTPLGKKEWSLIFVCVSIFFLSGALAWHMVSVILFPQPLTLLLLSGIFSLSGIALFMLVWLRLMLAHVLWLKTWVIAAPVVGSSIILLPIHSLLIAPGAICVVMLCGVWGYYRCYSPFIGLEVRLHRARFTRRHEIADLYAQKPEGSALLLGVNHWYPQFRRFVVVRSTKTRKELGNLLVVAPTRLGKGLLAISQLLSWQQSIVVNDIKGELFSATAGYRSTLGPVFVIDPTGIGHCYDPLTGKETEDQLFSSASHLLFDPNERDPIFSQRATVMLAQLFAAAKREGIPAIPYVRQITRLGLEATAKRLNTLSPDLATQFLDVSLSEVKFSDRFLHSAWSTLTTKLRPLLTETVVRCFTHSDFTPETLMRGDKPVTVYLRWKEQDLETLAPLVRLLWGSIINELITVYDSNEGKGCKPVLLLIDEAGRTAIPYLADQATTVVGRHIYLWIAIQSLSQLEAVYGKEKAQIMRDNVETQVYYRPQDLLTAKYLEDRAGMKSGFAKSSTVRDGPVHSEGQAERPVALITAQEVMQLRDEEIIGFHRRLPPFKMRRLEWFKHKIFQKRRSIHPPQLPILPVFSEKLEAPVLDQTMNGFIDPDEVVEK